MNNLVILSMDWHIHRSDAFRDLLIAPMQPYTNGDLQSWDGVSPITIDSTKTYIFCQLKPPSTLLEKIPNKIIWIPMWDNVQMQPQSWWNRLPKTLRIVAFSEAVYQRASKAGLPAIRLHYYKNPQDFQPVDWSHGRVLLYWNRVGLLDADFLEQLCKSLHITKLLFRGNTDPGQPDRAAYSLPERLGDTVVETIPDFKTRDEYLHATHQANIFIAPRLFEGVGMAFLEALARGCCVLAYNSATMNEYVTAGEDGFLFNRHITLKRIRRSIQGRLANIGIGNKPSFIPPLQASDQDWNTIKLLNVERLGQVAYERHQAGYQLWQSEIERYATFVLGDI